MSLLVEDYSSTGGGSCVRNTIKYSIFSNPLVPLNCFFDASSSSLRADEPLTSQCCTRHERIVSFIAAPGKKLLRFVL